MDVKVQIKSKKEGELQEIVVSEPEQFVLGRGPSSAALLDGPGISREHVAVSVNLSEVFVTDLSVNGAWLNGKRLSQQEKQRVQNEDVVEIPGYELIFRFDEPKLQVSPANTPIAKSEASVEQLDIPISAVGSVSAFLGSFTTLDRFMIVVALISIIVAVLYMLSS
jgi:pSer/pThr/pTyr-binding forkhead associated (FHA) protein